MQAVGVPTASEYRQYLEEHEDEFVELFNTILINVTGFFRDAEAWPFVTTDVVPALLEARSSGPLRIWSTGCATGEEAYTAAIVLAEGMGLDQAQQRLKIYATDVDDDALSGG